MVRRLTEVLASALTVLVVGFALWPPGAVYWTAVAARIGDAPTMAAVLLLAGGVGAAIGVASDVELWNVAAGGAVAYAVGMVLAELVLSPDSPSHLVLYGGLLLCILFGTVAGRAGLNPVRRRIARS